MNPIAFEIGPLSVHWYGLFYGVGLVFAAFLMPWLARRRGLHISAEAIIDFLFWIFLIGIIGGGRLGYILFYNLPYYFNHPAEIFAVWKGGMSFHGGLLGAILVAFLYCRQKKIDLLSVADITVIPAALALALGRLGNFINGELVGRVIQDPRWNFLGIDTGDGVLRYPSQLFATGKDVMIFVILMILFLKIPTASTNPNSRLDASRRLLGEDLDPRLRWYEKRGGLFATFLIVYGAFRFIVEFWRAPDPQIGFILGFLTLGQGLSLGVLSVGLWLVRKLRRLT